MPKPESNPIYPDLFLSRVLDRPVFKLNPLSDPLEMQKHIQSLNPGSFCYAKISPDNLQNIAKLESIGFRLIETNLIFSKSSQYTSEILRHLCRPARPSDESAVVEIAESAYTQTRFHLDPNLNPGSGTLVKENWVRNYFKGERGDGLLVAEAKDSVVGFLLWLQQNTTLIIDLIAVSPRYQGQGVGYSLIRSLELLNLGQVKLVVGTQLINHRSTQFYEKFGFKLERADYVFHLHKV